MVIQGYLLSFEQWLKKMEVKNKKLTAFFIGVWVFGTVGFVIKAIYMYSDMGHKISEWAICLIK